MTADRDVRATLVSTGIQLLEDEGLGRLSLRRIAQAAGLSHGAPRHHFPTYEALLAAMARCGLEDLDAELAPYFSREYAGDALACLATVYLDFARRRPEMFALVTRHDLLEGAGGHLREITGAWFARLVELTGGDQVRALALWSGLHGLAVLSRTGAAVPLLDAPPHPAEVAALLVARLGAAEPR